jgi:hypothetical protein
MRSILADNDVEGPVILIHALWLSDTWRDLWNDLGFSMQRIPDLGLSRGSPDAVAWRAY